MLYPAVALLTVLVTRARSGLEDGSLRPEAAWVRTEEELSTNPREF